MLRTTSILFLALLFNASVYAQGWWQWGVGSIGNNIESWPVATDPFGNVYVAGVSTGAVSFDNNNLSFATNGDQVVLAKYDPNGDFLWSRSTQNNTNVFLVNITTDIRGNCYLLGWLPDTGIEIGSFKLHNTAYPDAQYFVAKFDPKGDVIWAKNAGGRSGAEVAPPVTFNNRYAAKMLSLGGISTDLNGNVYITSCFNLPSVTISDNTLFNKDPTGATDDILLVKYDTSGNVMWATSSGGSGEDIPYGVTITPGGSIYIAGMFNSDSITFGRSLITDTCTGAQRWNAFVGRYNASGNPVWGNGSGGAGAVFAAGIASDGSGNVYITGGFAAGNISFGDTNITDLYPANPMLYLIKFDTSNKVDWYKTIGSPTGGVAWGYAIASSSDGYVCVSGAFNDGVIIDSNLLRIPVGSVDPIFIACFDPRGKYIASGALQSGADDQVGIAWDPFGSIYLCADYDYPCAPFIIANDVLADVEANEEWLYLAKYSFSGSSGPGGAVDKPDTLYQSQNISMCPTDTIFLNAPSGYALYRWNNRNADTTISVTTGGTYWVMGIGKENATIVDTFNVITYDELCNCNAALPNAFTPNDDGKDDTYGPIFLNGCAITRYAFSIFNRWGQRVFYSEDPFARWDGKFEEVPAPMDVYMYYLKYATNPNYPEHTKKGDVTLIR